MPDGTGRGVSGKRPTGSSRSSTTGISGVKGRGGNKPTIMLYVQMVACGAFFLTQTITNVMLHVRQVASQAII
jgi:hypothetical protein